MRNIEALQLSELESHFMMKKVKLDTTDITESAKALLRASDVSMPYISHILSDNNIDVIINLDAATTNDNLSVLVINNKGEIINGIYGNALFLEHDANGDFVDLSIENRKLLLSLLNSATIYSGDEGKEYSILTLQE